MFRLIKLAMLAFMGYAIYEFFRGLSGADAANAPRAGRRDGRGRRQSQPHLGAGNMQFSGSGEGRREQTEETSGTATPHYVGRGVVQR